jgi:hypothetical protein
MKFIPDIIAVALGLLIGFLLFWPAHAATYCRPPLIEQVKNSCPTGYYTQQGCCQPYHADKQPQAFPKKEGNCPTGTHQSGSFCIPYK